jgi:high affinity Mn2+ porin
MSGRLATRACHCAIFVKRTITKKIAFACVVVLLIAPHGPARSGDLGAGASPFTPNWTGAYVGGHFGYGIGSFGSGTNPILAEAVLLRPTVTGLVGGFQAGYNVQLPNKLVLGAEADLSFPSPIDRPATGTAPFNTTIDYFGTARARIGYALGNVLPYSHGAIQSSLPVDPKIQVFEFGLNYRLPELSTSFPSESAGPSTSSVSSADNWNLHGQTTFIWQGYGPIRSPYQGENSLPGSGEGRETWTATAFIGWRLWQGGEFYFDPELAQGFGLANTLGLGGFANGEAEKAGSEFPKIRAQRYFFRQTFGLGGKQEPVEDAPNQLAGKRDVDRVTLTIGRFAVGDIFDNNTYAHDPRVDFMNWAMWSSAAYDYRADLPGFTLGAVAEFNRKNWGCSGGAFSGAVSSR